MRAMESKNLKKKIREFFKFSLVGIVSSVIIFFGTVLLTELFGVAYAISYGINLFLSYIYRFLIYMKLVFIQKDRPILRIRRFAAVSIFIIILNWALVVFLVELFHITYWIAIILTLTALSLFNFKMQDSWVFRDLSLSETEHHMTEDKQES